MMNSRERALIALDHREPDRIPFDLGKLKTAQVKIFFAQGRFFFAWGKFFFAQAKRLICPGQIAI